MAGDAYSLTPVDETGDNTITKYVWDKDKNELVPQYYRIDYKTSYGEGDSVKSYTLPDGKTTIDYYYDTENLLERISNSKGNYGDITGNFVNASKPGSSALINALDAQITNLKGDFVDNYGALSNSGLISAIVGDFIVNSSSYSGGAIYNAGTIEFLKGDFVGNTLTGTGTYSKEGGAIYNKGIIGNISGSFIENRAELNYSSSAQGGAIYNTGTIDDIAADFINNKATASATFASSTAQGGAIYNTGTIGNISGNFINNSTQSTSSYDFRNSGGAIYNSGLIESIVGSFVDNSSVYGGGAIMLWNGGTINYLKADFINNSSSSSSSSFSSGGAIYIHDGSSTIGEIVNSNFIENHSGSRGGAIYSNNDLNITADSGTSTFRGNFVENQDGTKDYQAIYVAYTSNTLNFDSKNGGVIFMHDNINGSKGYNVNITGDNTGRFALYNDIYNANVTLGDTTLDTINNKVHTNHFDSFTLSNNANMTVDVDLATETMDRITADSYGKHNGNLTVTGMNLTSDMTGGKDSTAILFAEQGLKDNVTENTLSLPTGHQTTAYTPIYKYDVTYDNRDDAGYFVFNRGGLNSSNASDNYNPAVLSTPVAAQAGGQSVISETVRFAFQHADMFSQMPYAERMAFINQNRYAISEGTPAYSDNFENLEKGVWVKPFTSFEKINLHNGPDVDAITYGTLIGFDSDFNELRNGWYNVHSAYVGYNGSSLNYNGVDTTLNGGLAGLTETFYKGNFFTAITGTAGASVGTNNTMYGNEDYTMLLGGVGTKTGYNFEFKNGKYILQPILFMNYSFVNTFDYTNAAGVRMKNDPFHTFQINPSVKAVANLKNGWQPYASVGFVWNVLNSGKVTANNVVLPKMSVDPYVEYGVGVQKSWKDKFTGYGQAMVRNGGRNGVALTFGFRWALGKDTEDL